MAKIPTSINSLVANISHWGNSYPHKYEIAFSNLDALSNLRLCVSCETCTMPGRNISTQDIKMHGPINEMPYETSYSGDLDVTFKLSKDFKERVVFEQWQNEFIVSPDTHNFGYLDNYKSEIEITQLDEEDNPIHRIILEDAWPKTIAAIEYGDEKGNELNKQRVGFSFRKWRSEKPDAPGFLEGILGNLDLIGRLERAIMPFGGQDSPIPMIPTAIGGHVVRLPWGLDPQHMTGQLQDILGDVLGDVLGDII